MKRGAFYLIKMVRHETSETHKKLWKEKTNDGMGAHDVLSDMMWA
jgi:hypothetical protein